MANSCSYALLGYAVSCQFFPNTVQDGNTRFRTSERFQAIAEQYKTSLKDHIKIPRPPTAKRSDRLSHRRTGNTTSTTNQPFPSEQNKVGPYVSSDDSITPSSSDRISATQLPQPIQRLAWALRSRAMATNRTLYSRGQLKTSLCCILATALRPVLC